MSTRVILLCEGPEDAAVLRELLLLRWAFTRSQRASGSTGSLVGEPKRQSFESADGRAIATIVNVGGKSNLPKAWPAEALAGGYDAIGVCFDPNGQGESIWRRDLFSHAWNAAEPGLPVLFVQADGSYVASGPAGSSRIIPVPWTCRAPVWASLPDEHLLERIVVSVCGESEPELATEIERWIDTLRALQRVVHWKTAARLWHAVLEPKQDVAAFSVRVLCGSKYQRSARPLLASTGVHVGLCLLLGDPTEV